jgi:hypothetical protein
MISFRKILQALAAGSMVFVMPAVAFANSPSAWSAVKVNQSQSGVSWGHGSDLTQSADISTFTSFDNQASAQSKTTGSQGLWFQGKASQEQELTASSQLNWDRNAWPTNVRAETSGSVEQNQMGWSSSPMMLKEDASLWQNSKVGQNSSMADANIHQNNAGVVGDASQKQSLAGETGTEGWVMPSHPWWSSGASSFGGRLVQTVQVMVQNILTF